MNEQNNEMTVENAAAEFDLDDLLLTAAQEEGIRAGRGSTSAPPPPCFGCSWGPPVLNHNETVAEDDVTEAESLADLPLTAAQAEATKAGGGTKAASGEFPYIVSFQQRD